MQAGSLAQGRSLLKESGLCSYGRQNFKWSQQLTTVVETLETECNGGYGGGGGVVLGKGKHPGGRGEVGSGLKLGMKTEEKGRGGSSVVLSSEESGVAGEIEGIGVEIIVEERFRG